MTGVGIHDNEEFENALVGLMLFVTTTDCSIIDDETQTRGGSFKDCFIEATGIGAGVALVAGLSKGVVSKAVVRGIDVCITYIVGRNNRHKYVIMWAVLFSQLMLALWTIRYILKAL